MKILSGILFALALLMTGAAVGFQAGKSAGFEIGSEWALIQAELLAREAGVFMPVHMDDGEFRVVMKQPPGLYRRAWRLSELNDQTSGVAAKAEQRARDEERACDNPQQLHARLWGELSLPIERDAF